MVGFLNFIQKVGHLTTKIILAFSDVTAIMMLYRITKVKVCSPDGDTNFFDIVAGVLQGDTLEPYLFKLHTSNIDRPNKRKWLYTKKKQEAENIQQKL